MAHALSCYHAIMLSHGQAYPNRARVLRHTTVPYLRPPVVGQEDSGGRQAAVLHTVGVQAFHALSHILGDRQASPANREYIRQGKPEQGGSVTWRVGLSKRR